MLVILTLTLKAAILQHVVKVLHLTVQFLANVQHRIVGRVVSTCTNVAGGVMTCEVTCTNAESGGVP